MKRDNFRQSTNAASDILETNLGIVILQRLVQIVNDQPDISTKLGGKITFSIRELAKLVVPMFFSCVHAEKFANFTFEFKNTLAPKLRREEGNWIVSTEEFEKQACPISSIESGRLILMNVQLQKQ